MFGSKSYELPLNRNYVRHWGMPQAIRELLQNALDSESPFVYGFTNDETAVSPATEGWSLKLTSEFATLEPRTLLLGTTSKASEPTTIGSFGEGYKIALLVLAREGYQVDMLNGDVKWTPAFKHSRTFGDEVLVIEETPLPHKNKGLTVIVRGLDENAVHTIRDSCLKMQLEVGEVHDTRFGRVLVNRPGKLYVGSLYVCDTGFRYGYDIKPEHLKLERDRQTVSDWDLGMLALEMLLEAKSYAEVAKMILDNVPDVRYAEWNMPQLLKEEVYRQWRENFPGKTVARDHQELKALVAQGFKQTVVVTGSVYGAITSNPDYKASIPKIQHGEPVEMLREWFAKHSGCLTHEATKDWAAILMQAKFWEWK